MRWVQLALTHFAAVNDHEQLPYYASILKTHVKSCTRSNYHSDNGSQQETLTDQAAFLPMLTGIPQQQTRVTHWKSHRSCLDIRQLMNTVEYLSIYSKDFLYTHTCFGTKTCKKRQRVLTVCMAAGGFKGLIYLEARACFSVDSGIRIEQWP